MNVENQVHPDPSAIKPFIETEGTVCMVNLLKFKYASEMKKLVEASGGRFIFGATCVGMLLGVVEEEWDVVGIVEYPSARALIEISSTEAFQAIEVHREAGLKGQLNITTQEAPF
jgi:uncharacterized protein (DUF1330 family)